MTPIEQLNTVMDCLIKTTTNDPITIIELGCNNGWSTLTMSKYLKKTNRDFVIYGFEPDKRFVEELDNHFDNISNIHINYLAVGKTNGFVDFYVSDGDKFEPVYIGSSSIKKPRQVIVDFPITFTTTIVESIKLDTFCRKNKITHIDLIWADVQGAEKDVIAGAKNILNQTNLIFTEYHNGSLYWGDDGRLYEDDTTLPDICALLPQFKIVKDFGGDVLMENSTCQ